MPTSPDGILQAEFDTAWAAVRLVVDGGMWPSAVDTLTITRRVDALADVAVRDLEDRSVVAGYYVGSDTEMDLGVTVTYVAAGYGSGVLVATATVSVSTEGAAAGLWVKVPGQPDLTVLVPLRATSEISSTTTGAVYQIAGGGGSVTQSTAQWSGVETDQGAVEVSPRRGTEMTRLRAALAAGRVLLLQPVGSDDLDAGWYYVSDATRSNPGGFAGFAFRVVTLSVQRTGVPAGSGSGLAGVSWASVTDTYETWAEFMGAFDTWFDAMQGS